jgi:hypothetical protein
LLALGLSRTQISRLVRRGHLIRVHRGVYAVGHDRLTARGRWMAAVLACGPRAVLSHRAAIALWDLSAIPSGTIDVTAPTDRRIPGIRCHRSRTVHPDDRATIDGIPVTSLPRALLDRAQTLHPQRLRTLMEQAQRRDVLDFFSLDALLARSRGRRGAAALRAVRTQLEDEPPWTASELERRFLEFVRTNRLPEPRTNVLVDGILVDCFWPECNLIAELDGYEFHQGRPIFESDRRRRLAHARAGRQSINITQQMISRDGSALRRDLSALLDPPARARRRDPPGERVPQGTHQLPRVSHAAEAEFLIGVLVGDEHDRPDAQEAVGHGLVHGDVLDPVEPGLALAAGHQAGLDPQSAVGDRVAHPNPAQFAPQRVQAEHAEHAGHDPARLHPPIGDRAGQPGDDAPDQRQHQRPDVQERMGQTRRMAEEQHHLISLSEHGPRVEGGIPDRH